MFLYTLFQFYEKISIFLIFTSQTKNAKKQRVEMFSAKNLRKKNSNKDILHFARQENLA
jgi:hypothetical protein